MEEERRYDGLLGGSALDVATLLGEDRGGEEERGAGEGGEAEREATKRSEEERSPEEEEREVGVEGGV